MIHRALIGATAAAWLVCAGAVAQADEGVVTVNVTSSGPDRPFPLRSAFNIAGTVSKDVTEVHPVFVRYSFPPWGIPSSDTDCAQVKEALDATPSFASTGVVPISAVWPKRPTDRSAKRLYDRLQDDHEAYLPNSWKRSPGDPDNAAYKVLVPATTFFKDGAHYCLLLYQKGTVVRDTAALVAALDEFVRIKNPGAAEQAKLSAAIAKATKGLPDAGPVAQRLAGETAGVVSSLAQSGEALLRAADRWPGRYHPRPVDRLESVEDGHLLGMMLSVLGQTTYVKSIPVDRTGGFFTPGGVRIQYGQLLGEKLFVASQIPVRPPQPAPPAPDQKGHKRGPAPRPPDSDNLVVPLAEVPFAQSPLSLKDVLQLVQGRIRVDGAWRDPRSLVDPLRALRTADPRTTYHLDAAARAPLEHARTFIEQSMALLERAARAADYTVPLSATDESALHQLAAWLDPGGLRLLQDELERLRAKLADYARDLKQFDDKMPVLKETVIGLLTPSIDITLGMTRNTWFFSYVTIVTGYAAITRATNTFWLNYVGLQIYLWPNPVDQPMWTNGVQDWRRLFSLELAMATSNGPFGPDQRYGGFTSANVPPLFIGLALQPIPYVTASVGLAILSSKKSTLAEERAQTFLSPYVGLSVQINVPDTITAIKGRTVSVTPPQ